jgi:hypothetical protein
VLIFDFHGNGKFKLCSFFIEGWFVGCCWSSFGRTAACELLSSSFLGLLSSSLRAHASLLLLALKGGKRMGRRERGAGLVLWGNGAVQVCTILALVLTATGLSANIYICISLHIWKWVKTRWFFHFFAILIKIPSFYLKVLQKRKNAKTCQNIR